MRLRKRTEVMVSVLGLILLIGIMPAGAAVKEKYEEKFEETVSLAKDGDVYLENISGKIDIKSWDKAEVKIDALKVSTASTLSEAKENAAEVKIIVEPQGNTLRVKTEYPEHKFGKKSSNVSVSYNLWIPAKASVNVHSVSGDVSLGGIGGKTKVYLVSGDITVVKAEKDVDCESVSGKIGLQDIGGDAYLKTVSGGIKVSGIKGSVKANATSGSVELMGVSGAKFVDGNVLSGSITYEGKLNAEGRYTFNTHSGNVEIMLPSDSSFELEARTFSGRIDSEFEMTVSGKLKAKAIQGTVNKGGAFVKLTTFSGNITLRKR